MIIITITTTIIIIIMIIIITIILIIMIIIDCLSKANSPKRKFELNALYIIHEITDTKYLNMLVHHHSVNQSIEESKL